MYRQLKASFVQLNERKRPRSMQKEKRGFARASQIHIQSKPAPQSRVQRASTTTTTLAPQPRPSQISTPVKAEQATLPATSADAKPKPRAIFQHEPWRRLHAFLQLRCHERTCPQGARGMILHGPPGSGKTFALETIAANLSLRIQYIDLWDMPSGPAMEHALVLASRTPRKTPTLVVADHAEVWALCSARRQQLTSTEDAHSEFFTLDAWTSRTCSSDAPIILVVNGLVHDRIRRLRNMEAWTTLRFDPFTVHVPKLRGLTSMQKSLIYECGGDLRAVKWLRRDSTRVAPGTMARASMFRAAQKIMHQDHIPVLDVDEINRDNPDVAITVWEHTPRDKIHDLKQLAEERHVWSLYEQQPECAMHINRALYTKVQGSGGEKTRKMTYSCAFDLRKQKYQTRPAAQVMKPGIEDIVELLTRSTLDPRSYRLFD